MGTEYTVLKTSEEIEKARVSFEAGYNKALAQLAGMAEECKQMGRKEVVEWLNLELGFPPYPRGGKSYLKWPAFLRENGLEGK